MSTKNLPHDQDSENANVPFWVSRVGARIALIALHTVALITIIVEFLWPLAEEGHGAERIHELDFFASYAIYGFVACVFLVLLGRELRRLVMRKSDYWENLS